MTSSTPRTKITELTSQKMAGFTLWAMLILTALLSAGWEFGQAIFSLFFAD